MKNYWAIIKQAISVDSSHVSDLSYNEVEQILTITWKNGRRYEYFNVPKDVYEDFLNAPSHGVYLNKVFKPMDFRFQEIV